MNVSKKKRGSNFSSQEINLFVKCLVREIDIIEMKKNDNVTVREKNLAWQRIADNFNAITQECQRDAGSLRTKFENIKKFLKKKVIEHTQHERIEGSCKKELHLAPYEEILFASLKTLWAKCGNESGHTFFEMPQSNDDSGGDIYIKYEDVEEPDNTEDIHFVVDDSLHEFGHNLPPESHNTQVVSEGDDENSSTALLANRWNFKTGIKRSVEDKVRNLDTVPETTTSGVERRESHPPRVEVEHGKEEWELKKQILEEELKMKKIECEHKKAIFAAVEEQEKIKIEILKCELRKKMNHNLSF